MTWQGICSDIENPSREERQLFTCVGADLYGH